MALTADSVIQYHITHPPFAITDQGKYIDLIQHQVDVTLQELSENDPIVDEKQVTIPAIVGDTTGYAWLDLYTNIHASFMSFILFDEVDHVFNVVNDYELMYTYRLSHSLIASAIDHGNLANIVALHDAPVILNKWLNATVEKLVYKNSKLKVRADVPYYAIYRRYRELSELPPSSLLPFKNLLGCNVILGAYESDAFMSEDGLRSFSMSGLSISFNSPEVESRLRETKGSKQKILESLAIDGEDIGIF